MKFLTKLAQIFAKGLQLVGLFGPVVQQAFPGATAVIQPITTDIESMGLVIADIEQVGVALKLAGPDKLKAAAPLIADIILRSTLLANHKVANADLFNQGVTSVASGMADILNSLHTDGIEVVSKAA